MCDFTESLDIPLFLIIDFSYQEREINGSSDLVAHRLTSDVFIDALLFKQGGNYHL